MASNGTPRSSTFFSGVAAKFTRHPFLAIAAVSFLAVVINCYPILFCGRSYVSPTSGSAMVYDSWPPLPGMTNTHPVWHHGCDTVAALIWSVPMGFVESRSLLEQGEIPLWNRYSHAGDTLIGQTTSGDPLQWIVILGHGSAGAWDIKFLLAKYIFCAGFGLLIFRLFGNVTLALVFTALAAYSGAFFFIHNHPVFFAFCYAPWVLFSAIGLVDPASKNHLRWGLLWLLANFACFNAGHVEVGVVLIGGLNLAALASGWAAHRNPVTAAKMTGRMAVATLFFLALTAPVWMAFLGALAGAYSAHANVYIHQLPFTSIAGLFDDLFYLSVAPENMVLPPAPGSSLLIITGCVLSWRRWRQARNEPFFWINSLAIVIWTGCVFGAVPAAVLKAVPLLNRVNHLCADFSYLVIIHLTIQCAYGFRSLAGERNLRRTMIDLFWVALVFAAATLLYWSKANHLFVPWNYLLCVGAAALGTPWLYVFLNSRDRAASAAGVAGIVLLALMANFRFGLYSFGNEDRLIIPGPRVTLNAPSPAIEWTRADKTGPFRVTGTGWSFYGDYAAVYGLEDIHSCAPLSNDRFMHLINHFPGIDLERVWIIKVVDPVTAQPLLNLLNVKYVLSTAPMDLSREQGFRIATNSDFHVLENREAWPRAFFTDQAVSVDSNEAFVSYLIENRKKPFIALTPDEIKKLPDTRMIESGNATVIPATHYQLLPNSTSFDVHATSAGMVCLTEGQAKDFIATANGKRKEVLTVNRAFKGIYLDTPGDYHVEFIYRPYGWRMSYALFWAALATIAGWAVFNAVRKKRI
jgi:hypothetical protein